MGTGVKTVAVFRSADDAQVSAARLAEHGFVAVRAPVLAPTALAAEPPSGGFDAAVATSAKALDFGSDALIEAVRPYPLFVVGRAARDAAKRRGLEAVGDAEDVDALVAELAERLPSGARVLYLAGVDRKPDLEAALAERGVEVRALAVYVAAERDGWTPAEARAVAGADFALHYSRRSAEIAARLAAAAGFADRWRDMVHVAISADAAAPLAGLRVEVAAAPNEAAMFEALIRAAGRAGAPPDVANAPVTRVYPNVDYCQGAATHGQGFLPDRPHLYHPSSQERAGMAEDTIQDDHPEIPPVSVPKPHREPLTIEGEAVDVTPAADEAEGVAAEAHAPAGETAKAAESAPVGDEPAALPSEHGSIPEASEADPHGDEPAPTAGEEGSEGEPPALIDERPAAADATAHATSETLPEPVEDTVVSETGPAESEPATAGASEPEHVAAIDTTTAAEGLLDGGSAEAAPAPPEAEASAVDDHPPVASEAAAEPAAPAAGPASPAAAAFAPPPAEPAKRSGAGGLITGGVSALIGAAAAYAAVAVLPPNSAPLQTVNDRIAAAQAAISSETSARGALESQVAALQSKSADAAMTQKLADFEARLAALEKAAPSGGALAAVSAEAKAAKQSADKVAADVAALAARPAAAGSTGNSDVQKFAAEERALGDRISKLDAAVAALQKPAGPAPEVVKLTGDQQALADRVGKLDAAISAVKAALPTGPDPELVKLAADEKALVDRVGKVETTFSTQTVPAERSLAAMSLERRLSAGQPFTIELAALEKLDAPADALAALKPYAETGAPTTASLAAGFAKLAPALAAPIKAAHHGDYAETIWDEVKSLVKVHPVGEVQGDDPAAVTSQITAALARGDLAAARAGFAKLPKGERESAGAWAKDLEGAFAARSAALSLIDGSLVGIAQPKK